MQQEYFDFVEKFKPKKTTDDCYTPENVYEAIKDWAVKYYKLEGREIVRPFWPGGDYENYDYPNNCVVIDNPPFSILAKIKRFYLERGIDFFLFAPTLTLFSSNHEVNYLPVGVSITYENGAVVHTSFVTNMGEWKIDGNPELYKIVEQANNENIKQGKRQLPKYSYPDYVLSATMINPLVRHGQKLQLKAESLSFTRALDSQRNKKKVIYGAGFLLSEKAAAEKVAAEKAAAEKAAAEKVAAEKAAAEKAAAEKWELSEREWEIIRRLK